MSQQIQDLEVSLEEAQKLVNRREALVRLSKNADFDELVNKGYFEQEAIRLTKLTAHPAFSEKQREDVVLELKSISIFYQYLHNIMSMGNLAAQEIEDLNEAIEAEAQDDLAGEDEL